MWQVLNPLADAEFAIAAVERLAAVGILIAGLEFLTSPQQLSDDGLISWRVGSLRRPGLTNSLTGRVFDALFKYPNVLLLVAFSTIASSLILVAPTSYIVQPWIVIPVAACLGSLFVRNSYGYDGADQLLWIIFAGLVLVSIVGTQNTKTVYLWFIAAQVSLAYGVAGIAKASAKGWRDGSFLVGILGTGTYGNARVAAFLSTKPKLVTLQSRLIILFECSFLFILLLPHVAVIFLLLASVAFHAVNAYVMGLNTFVWAFFATYPALLFCVLTRGW